MSKHFNTILAVAYASNVPLLLWGPPGVGKTARVEAFGASNGIPTETLIASIREPADFAGYPVPSNGALTLLPPDYAFRLAKHREGVLFIDELTTAPPAVQAACLRVINAGWVGDLRLPKGIRRWAAANPPDMAADGNVLAAPLANRFMHVNVDLTAAEWTSGAMNGWAPMAYAPPPIGWEAGLPSAMASVAGFIQRRPGLLRMLPKDDAARGGAWASPRSWDMAARVLAVCDAYKAGDEVMALCLAGCVGEGPALELLAWRRDADLPDPETLLAKGQWTVPVDGSKAFAIMASITAAVVSNPTTARWATAWDLFAQGAQTHGDLAALCGRSMAMAIMPIHKFPAPKGMMTMAQLLKKIGGFA